jgi:hypothetical protein
MNGNRLRAAILLACLSLSTALGGEPLVAKRVLRVDPAENLLQADGWRPCQSGFTGDTRTFVCDNGGDSQARRGVMQTVQLDQTRPEPIVASVSSKAEGVSGSPDSDYSLYLDLVYSDGTPLWGQAASFATGSHDWQKRQVMVLPEKPVKRVTLYLLLRGHGGKACFRDARLGVVPTPQGACLFDGVPLVPAGGCREGFQIRDVAAGSDYLAIEPRSAGYENPAYMTDEKLGIRLVWYSRPAHSPDRGRLEGATLYNLSVYDTTGKDRAIMLLYTVPVAAKSLRWLGNPRESTAVQEGREYLEAARFRVGSNGRLSRYPFAAVADAGHGVALGSLPLHPAFCRTGYNAGTGELFLAWDIGLAPEKQRAELEFCQFTFEPQWGFRAALARYYEIFPRAFRCRTLQQGLWMPFAKISQVEGWQDFGFRFKEGNDETGWDDQHGILTFRYTEPMTWWMPMPKAMPRTLEAALAEAKRLAEQGRPEARALLTSGYHDADGRFVARLEDTPWCNGAVWSLNSMPAILGEFTDFKNKWNWKIERDLYAYGPLGKGLDGEYVDSSEGYATAELDFRREHFAAAETPLVFSLDERRPAIFRGLVALEYVRGLRQAMNRRDRLLMANGTPGSLWWLAPMLDVMGTETDWNPGGRWQPMCDAELLYRRALCKGKPYCFLMNTRFEAFPPALVEKYMKRCLAYGMFPGFFSHNASGGAYFTRAELYNRDRPLFKKYVPLCKRVAEAGWEPITRAASGDPRVYVERFGEKYLTVFNDSPERKTATITLDGKWRTVSRELLAGQALPPRATSVTLTLDGEDVEVLELGE